jgi:hypothetical protein
MYSNPLNDEVRGARELVSGSPCLGCMGVGIRTSVFRGAWVLVSRPPCLGVHGSWYQDLRV